MSTPEIPATVSAPTPIPQRPTLYLILRPDPNPCGWAVLSGGPETDPFRINKEAAQWKGSLIVTIPSNLPKPKDEVAGTIGDDFLPPGVNPIIFPGPLCADWCVERDSRWRAYIRSLAGKQAEMERLYSQSVNMVLALQESLDKLRATPPTPDAGGVRPWPSDLSTLVGKRITMRMWTNGAIRRMFVINVGPSFIEQKPALFDHPNICTCIEHYDLLSIEEPSDPKPSLGVERLARLQRIDKELSDICQQFVEAAEYEAATKVRDAKVMLTEVHTAAILGAEPKPSLGAEIKHPCRKCEVKPAVINGLCFECGKRERWCPTQTSENKEERVRRDRKRSIETANDLMRESGLPVDNPYHTTIRNLVEDAIAKAREVSILMFCIDHRLCPKHGKSFDKGCPDCEARVSKPEPQLDALAKELRADLPKPWLFMEAADAIDHLRAQIKRMEGGKA